MDTGACPKISRRARPETIMHDTMFVLIISRGARQVETRVMRHRYEQVGSTLSELRYASLSPLHTRSASRVTAADLRRCLPLCAVLVDALPVHLHSRAQFCRSVRCAQSSPRCHSASRLRRCSSRPSAPYSLCRCSEPQIRRCARCAQSSPRRCS